MADKDQILFSCEQAGIRDKPMERVTRAFDWMQPKYGKDVSPWQISVEFDTSQSNIKYGYSICRGGGNSH